MIKEIHNKLISIYGKDISYIILRYCYAQCKHCNDYLKDYDFETCEGNYVCVYCYTKIVYKSCYTCKKIYEYNKGVQCISCGDKCRIYCYKCLKNIYRAKLQIIIYR